MIKCKLAISFQLVNLKTTLPQAMHSLELKTRLQIRSR